MIESDLFVKQILQFLFTRPQRQLLAYQMRRFPQVDQSSSLSNDEDKSDDDWTLSGKNRANFLRNLKKMHVKDKMTKDMLLSVLTTRNNNALEREK